MIRARLVRFYGFSDKELDVMRADKAFNYWHAINHLEAIEFLNELQLIKYSNLQKKSDRLSFENKLKRQTEVNRNKKALTTNEIIKELMRQ